MHPSRNTTLIAVRHGETVWNVEQRFQGHGDSPLTEIGRAQARALGRRLKSMQIEELISSDLGRAVETAAIIAAQTGLPARTDARLRERNFGVLEGLTAAEIQARHPGVFEKAYADDPDYAAPDGESLRQRYVRNIEFVEAMASAGPATTALVVHGGFLDSLFRFVAGLPLHQPRCFLVANAGMSRIVHGTFHGTLRWVVDCWNDVSHLDGIGARTGL